MFFFLQWSHLVLQQLKAILSIDRKNTISKRVYISMTCTALQTEHTVVQNCVLTAVLYYFKVYCTIENECICSTFKMYKSNKQYFCCV